MPANVPIRHWQLWSDRFQFREPPVSDFAVRLSALIDGLAVQVVLGDREEDAQIVSGDGGRRTRVRPAGFLGAVSYL